MHSLSLKDDRRVSATFCSIARGQALLRHRQHAPLPARPTQPRLLKDDGPMAADYPLQRRPSSFRHPGGCAGLELDFGARCPVRIEAACLKAAEQELDEAAGEN